MKGNQLEGDGTWSWLKVEVDGADLVLRSATSTWFGGAHDPEDSGATASGVSTKLHPDILGCALPMAGFGRATQGSPIPRLPWHTLVKVFCYETHKEVEVELIDLGPSKYTHHGLDLTVAAFAELGISMDQGTCRCDARIVDGARHIKGFHAAISGVVEGAELVSGEPQPDYNPQRVLPLEESEEEPTNEADPNHGIPASVLRGASRPNLVESGTPATANDQADTDGVAEPATSTTTD